MKAVDASLMAATILVIIPTYLLLVPSYFMDPMIAFYGDSAALDSLALTALVGHGTGLALAWIDWRAKGMDGALPDPGELPSDGSGGPPRDRP